MPVAMLYIGQCLAMCQHWLCWWQVIDLKGELANSKAGQAAIKHAVSAAAKEQAASAAREKALKVRPSRFILSVSAGT